LKSPRNATGIAMTNLHRSPPMNQSETDLGIVNESQLLGFGINTSPFKNVAVEGAGCFDSAIAISIYPNLAQVLQVTRIGC
jgi:hypothetical protein